MTQTQPPAQQPAKTGKADAPATGKTDAPAKTEAAEQKPKSTVKNAKKTVASSTQMHLSVAEIRDNLAILKNGGLRAVLKTSSVNVHLKSEEEQNSIIYGYQNFLNSLEFPIQIVVRSKKLDLDNYLDSLEDIADKQENKLLKEQTLDYMDYIKRLIEYADIMQKEFYVIVPYDPPRAKKVTMVQKFMQFMSSRDNITDLRQRHREFETLRKGLMQRLNIVKSGLQNAGLKADPLTTPELVTLFYECYNPRTSRLQKINKSDELDVQHDEDLVDPKTIEEEED